MRTETKTKKIILAMLQAIQAKLKLETNKIERNFKISCSIN